MDNMRYAKRFGSIKNKNGFWVDGFWMECGHFQKMPNGIRQDITSDRFIRFMSKAISGHSKFYCKRCK